MYPVTFDLTRIFLIEKKITESVSEATLFHEPNLVSLLPLQLKIVMEDF